MIKKIILLVSIASIFAACGENVEKKAGAKLTLAQTAYEQGDYAEAKLQIDSIKVLYPKAFEARKAANNLMMEVEMKVQQDTLNLLDSTLKEKQQAFEAIKSKFKLEKDAEYQQIGNYMWPTQTVEKNMHRSFLRFQTDELGAMSLTSIYCGGSNIHHLRIKVTAPDGSFAETPASTDSYETSDMGEKIEKADYKLGADGDVIKFIVLNKDKNLRVQYIGDRSYSTVMAPTDKVAAAEVYQLAEILADIQQIKKGQEAAKLKIEFITKKKAHQSEKETSYE